MASVQFRGMESVLRAYTYKGVDVWAIFDGKRLQHKGAGENELEEYLKLILSGGSTATLTLKIYEELDDPKKVKGTTPDDGSFNFKLVTIEEDGETIYRSNKLGTLAQMGETLSSIDQRLAKLESEEPGEEEDEEFSESFGRAVQKAIIGAVEDPAKLGTFISTIRALLDPVKPVPAIGNIHRAGIVRPITTEENINDMGNIGEQIDAQQISEEQLQRLSVALDTLGKHDPLIVEHLEKLAKVAEDKPTKFKGLISMLDFL